MTVLVYINSNDTCPPLLLVYQVSTTGTKFQLVPPGLAFPVALLRLPGVSPPRPAPFLSSFSTDYTDQSGFMNAKKQVDADLSRHSPFISGFLPKSSKIYSHRKVSDEA